MWKLLAWAHRWTYRGALWIGKLPFQSAGVFLKTALAWMHMEVRRWVGILVWGILVLFIARTIVKLSPPGSNWRLVALLLVLLWLLATANAARLTMEYLSFRRVRQTRNFIEITQGVQEIRGQVGAIPGQIRDEVAKVTAGSPVGRVFASNREAQAQREAEEYRRAVEAAERDELVAAMNAEHDPYD